MPLKEPQYAIVSHDQESDRDIVLLTCPSLEEASSNAEACARQTPGQIFTVYQAVAELKAGEVPVERTDYRRRRAGEAE